MSTAIMKTALEIQRDTRALIDFPETELYSDAIKAEVCELIEEAKGVERVINARTQELAVLARNRVHDKITAIEETRVSVKDPFLKMCQRIDKSTRELVAGLEAEKSRLNKAIKGFQIAEEQKAAKAKEAQEREQQRIAREAEELEQKKVAAEASGDTAAAEELELQGAVLQRQASDASQVIAPPKPEGLSVGKVWTFEVIGTTPEEKAKSLLAGATARPDLFTIEARTAIIKKLLKEKEGKETIPGLRVFEDTLIR